jgi:hypothetical protein
MIHDAHMHGTSHVARPEEGSALTIQHPHVAKNNWQTAQKWNKDGSLLVTIDNTIDGAGHTASAIRTVLLGFDKSGKGQILKSTVKYDSTNDNE